MRAREFVAEEASTASTSAGSIAPVSQPLGSMISRLGNSNPAKYMNSFNPGKKRKRDVSR